MNYFLQKKVFLPICLLIFALGGITQATAQYNVTFEVCGVPPGAPELTLFTMNEQPGTPDLVFGTQNPLTGDWSVSVTFTSGVLFPSWSLRASNANLESTAIIANVCPCAQPICNDVPGIVGNCTTNFMARNPMLNGVDGSVYKVNWGDPEISLVVQEVAINCPSDINVANEASATPDITGMATSDDPDAAINFTDFVTPATCTAGPMINRVWKAVNECGESATCIQQITTSGPTQDNFRIAYEVSNVPPSALAPWGGFSMFAPNGTPSFQFTTQTTPSGNYIHSVEYPCNGGTFQTFNFNNEVPVLINNFCPCAQNLCNDVNGIVGNCTTFMFHNPGMDGTFDASYGIEYGGAELVRIPSPIITGVPASIEISCSDPVPGDVGGIAASGGCGDGAGAMVSFSQSELLAGPGMNGVGIILNTWTVVDVCGNTTSSTQIVTIIDEEAPVINCDPMTVTVEAGGNTSPTAAGTGMATATDCDPDFTLTASDEVNTDGFCNGESVITRTWLATDGCGNTSTCVQTITINDSTAPVITTCPAMVGPIEGCDESAITIDNAGFIFSATAVDIPFDDFPGMADGVNSAGTATYIDVITDNSCPNPITSVTRTWTVTDECGNTSEPCEQIITIEDTTAPVVTCPANVGPIEGCDESVITAASASFAFSDTETVVLEADFVAAGGAIVEACGVESINYIDVITDMSCPNPRLSVTRTWTAIDNCGNISLTCDQIITVEDTTPPVLTCPATETLACNTDPLPLATTIADFINIGGTAGDNCSMLDDLTVSFSDNPASQSLLNFCPGTSEADRTLTRTYTITDACGNSSTCAQQFIYLESSAGPTITATPADQTVDCTVNAFPQLALFTAEGDCSNIAYSVSSPTTLGNPGCPGNRIQYTYTATDVCGRMVSHIQTYTLSNEGPEFVCPSDICAIECPADTDMIQAQFDDYANLATVITSCSEIGFSVDNDFNPNGFISQNCANPTVAVEGAVAYQVVRFTATDACGRNATCTALVVLKDSNGPVVNGGVSTGLADCNDSNLQQGYTDWANVQINGLSATDECSNGTVTYSYAPLSPNVDCSGGVATTPVSFTATDACGNTTVQTAFYQIIDNGTGAPVMATVAGTLQTEESEMIELAEVQVEGYMNNMMLTNADGYYQFDLLSAQNYTIEPSRNDDPLNGITTYDLILLGQHLLEINQLDSPYKMIAADINESGSITALDLIELRRMILHIEDEFSTGKSWTFVDAAFEFPQPTNPFATTFPTVANINNLGSGEIINFIGIKLGDLNASASPTLLQAGDTRSSDGSLNIRLEDQLLLKGQTYDLAFKASDFTEVEGFQFTLDFLPGHLELADYQSGELAGISAENFGFTKADQGKITMSWNATKGVSVSDEATLFEVRFTALKAGQLSELISINSSLTASEAYQADLLKEVVLDFEVMNTSPKSFALLQNQPNPFSQETVIGFQLTEAADATLTIFDISGSVVWQQKNTYEAGTHQVMMDKGDLGVAGVYYYQLSTRLHTATKKMILLN